MKLKKHHPKVSVIMRWRNYKYLFICGLFLLLSLPVLAQDPPQYGTPFSGVPDPKDVNMYQVNIRAFSQNGDLNGVTSRLDQIKALGTNVLYLMPIYPVGQDSRSTISPYCVKDFKTVGSEFGSLDDLRHLVDEAHARNMAVMLDFVVNQTSWDHQWISQHPDYYVRNGAGEIQPLPEFQDVAALNFDNYEMRNQVIEALRYWVFAANIDGYRMDYANNPPTDFWKQAVDNLRGISSHDLILFAEGDRTDLFTAGFDMIFGFRFYYDGITDVKDGASVNVLQQVTNSEYSTANPNQRVVRFTDNHDVNGRDDEFGPAMKVFGSQSAIMANFVACAYMRGVPFLYGGQEVGFNERNPWPWTAVDIDWNGDPAIANEYSKILSFRTESAAIRRGDLWNFSNNDILAFTKTYGSEQVLVAINLRGNQGAVSLPSELSKTGWSDAYSNGSISLGSTISLGAFEYKVFKKGTGDSGNHAPQVYAGADQSLSSDILSAILQGSATDEDGDQLSVEWTQVSGDAVSITSSHQLTAQVEGLQAGHSYVFRLSVSDGDLTATDEVVVAVLPQGTDGYVTIKNRWNNAYLYDDGDQAKYGDITGENAQWQQLTVDGYILFKNRATGDLLNVEHELAYVEASGAGTDFWSAQWELVETSGYVRIQNRWKSDSYINIENLLGYAEYTEGIGEGAYSSQWTIEAVSQANFELTIEAESYASMSGVEVEACAEGGSNVGYINAGDWMSYANINIPESGTYMVEYRVASGGDGGNFTLDVNAGANVLGEVSFANTGGWQNWTTVSHMVNINAGTYNFGIYALQSDWNINWLKITKVNSITARVDDIKSSVSVEVYPNPTSDVLHIAGNQVNDVMLLDSKGQILNDVKVENNEIDLIGLKSGIYVLKLITEDGITTKLIQKK